MNRMNATNPEAIGATENLDPEEWEAFSKTAHQALDLMLDHLRHVGEGPVWRQATPDAQDAFTEPLPRAGRGFAHVIEAFRETILPYATGNLHPLFLGWVHGAGTPYGMVAEMLAAGLNANCGGRNHIAIDVERQVACWAASIFGYPQGATGLFVTGTSMANFLALLVARDAALGHEVRRAGLRAAEAQLVLYASAEAHGCVRQAAELAGIGSRHLRLVPVDAAGAMDPDGLGAAIAADRRAGLRPFMIVGSAGTVNTGAIDPLERLAEVAETEGLWFHVDGAFGALAALSPALAPRLAGIDRSQSIAFDFHKWAHVPYDAGFLLVRDGAMHRGTFANPAAYLQRTARGTGAGETWPCDLGPDLSRGFRALKTWMTFQALGADRIGRSIARCCALARELAAALDEGDTFELAAPVSLNIVCFRLREGASREAHAEIVMDLQERGIAVPSLTTLGEASVIRAAIVNHRTEGRHIGLFVEAAVETARRLRSA